MMGTACRRHGPNLPKSRLPFLPVRRLSCNRGSLDSQKWIFEREVDRLVVNMHWKRPNLWLVCLALIGVPAAWLIIWVLTSRILGVSITSGADLATMMAAIG